MFQKTALFCGHFRKIFGFASQKKKARMAPGEMESITLKSAAFLDAKELKFVLEVR